MASSCVDLNIFGAVHTWFLGTKLDGFCLYGISTVWVGRFAKVMAFLSALTVLIDIVGEERVLASSNAMSEFAKLVRGRWRRIMYKIPLFRGEIPNALSVILAGLAFGLMLDSIDLIPMIIINQFVPPSQFAQFVWEMTYYPVLFSASVLSFIIIVRFSARGSVWLFHYIHIVLSNDRLCSIVRAMAFLIFTFSFVLDLLMS